MNIFVYTFVQIPFTIMLRIMLCGKSYVLFPDNYTSAKSANNKQRDEKELYIGQREWLLYMWYRNEKKINTSEKEWQIVSVNFAYWNATL